VVEQVGSSFSQPERRVNLATRFASSVWCVRIAAICAVASLIFGS
jgi:hypothetical protein